MHNLVPKHVNVVPLKRSSTMEHWRSTMRAGMSKVTTLFVKWLKPFNMPDNTAHLLHDLSGANQDEFSLKDQVQTPDIITHSCNHNTTPLCSPIPDNKSLGSQEIHKKQQCQQYKCLPRIVLCCLFII